MQGGIERSHFPEHVSAEKDGRLTDKTPLAQPLVVKEFGRIGRENLTLDIDVLPDAVDHAHLWMSLEIIYRLADCPTQVGIIGVQPGQDLATRSVEALL